MTDPVLIPLKTSEEISDLVPAVKRLARILARNPTEAEDMAQNALLQVWARLDKGGEIDDLRPYLMTTLRNTRVRGGPPTEPLDENRVICTDSDIWDRFAYADVSQAIDRLPNNLSDLLWPLVLDGARYGDLAAMYNLPIGTVMSRISRARAQLRADLELPKSHAVEALMGGTISGH